MPTAPIIDTEFEQEIYEAIERAEYFPSLAASKDRVAIDLYGKHHTLSGAELASRLRTAAIALENNPNITQASITLHSGKLWVYQK